MPAVTCGRAYVLQRHEAVAQTLVKHLEDHLEEHRYTLAEAQCLTRQVKLQVEHLEQKLVRSTGPMQQVQPRLQA